MISSLWISASWFTGLANEILLVSGAGCAHRCHLVPRVGSATIEKAALAEVLYGSHSGLEPLSGLVQEVNLVLSQSRIAMKVGLPNLPIVLGLRLLAFMSTLLGLPRLLPSLSFPRLWCAYFCLSLYYLNVIVNPIISLQLGQGIDGAGTTSVQSPISLSRLILLFMRKPFTLLAGAKVQGAPSLFK